MMKAMELEEIGPSSNKEEGKVVGGASTPSSTIDETRL